MRLLSTESSDLVIDVGDIHHEMNVVAKIVGHDPPQDVLGNVVPGVKVRTYQNSSLQETQ